MNNNVATISIEETKTTEGFALKLSTFAEAEAFAKHMAASIFMPKHLRNKPADCLMVLLQAQRWGNMDAIAVAQKTYFVNDGIGYEAQLINAVIISRAPIKERPHLEWAGTGENMTCTVSATFIGSEKPSAFTAEMKTITTRNSPLWKQQPKQQLGYFALRAWSRLYCPDVIMGVYSDDERRETKDITPQSNSKSAIDMLNETVVEHELLVDADGVIYDSQEDLEIAQSAPAPAPTEDQKLAAATKAQAKLSLAINDITDIAGVTAFLEAHNATIDKIANYGNLKQELLDILDMKKNQLTTIEGSE